MIKKMNNKEEGFYTYMGRMFGSRIVQRQTNDRIYDDNDKDWYLYIDEGRVACFVSVSNATIKNVYTIKENYLVEVLKYIKKEYKIQESVVPNSYKECYKKAGFSINHVDNLKNFIMIYDQ